MKTIVTTLASLAVLATMSTTVITPASADTIREVRCSDGTVVKASGTESNKQACLQAKFAAPTRKGAQSAKPMKVFKAPGHSPVAKPFDNTAYAWTAGCYAEFGPNAKYPDAALLEKCLNF
ncbi:MAG: hypothetical protein MnENMB40S_35960 [Rhizobiaceae bacterium MnEN-MB40S]|nr:MAG: hypothetical protein MnENMB40S_35960 [Rhizobiaceae bacterium MnEN-MB40S]